MNRRIGIWVTIVAVAAGCVAVADQDTFQPYTADDVPTTFEELWADYDPRKEPLDVEILKEFEEEGVVMKVVRFRVGIFKGQKAMMAAVYGYPKSVISDQSSVISGREGEREKLPGLVQAHGGGQAAHYNTCLTNAKRGYATISLAWTGRLHAPGYNVGGGEVKLFWEGKTNDPNYKVTTDWGPLDGYHAPGRYGRQFGGVNPDEHTIDPVESPRNAGWFLCALGARRALTFLEQQPEVDGNRLGVYGHSMGGQITSYAAGSDERVKAAAPSCGGFSYRGSKNINEELGWGNAPYLKNTTCPIIFLNPANDFHGRINYMPVAVSEIKTPHWRVTSAPHHNHNDTASYEVGTQLWFDQYLKGTFQWPATPKTEIKLNTASGVPSITVRPDTSKPIRERRVYYTQQGAKKGEQEGHQNKMHRFWRSAELVKQGDAWTADLPVYTIDRPLWVYANVHYPLDEPVSGVGYYYGAYTADKFNVSSLIDIIEPEALQSAGVKPTIKPTLAIEDFQGNWELGWFTYNKKPKIWERKTNKLYDPMHQAPDYAKLAFGMSSKQAGTLTVAVDGSSASFDLDGSGAWQDVAIMPLDLVNKEGDGRIDWKDIHLLQMSFKPAKDEEAKAPALRNLRWIEGTREELNARRKVRLDEAEVVDGKTYLDIQYADRLRQDLKTRMNTSFGGGPLAIGEKVYERGIGTHANSEILFFLKGQYKRFYAEAGVQKGLPASIRFSVFADGKPVFESGMMTQEQGPKVIDLDVTGVDELELVVDDGGNGKHADHANWAEAYVAKEAVSTPSSLLISPKDYTYAYWKNGWRKHAKDSSPGILCFESGYYGFMLDVAKLNSPKFGAFEDNSNVLTCLESGTSRMDTLPEAELDISLEHAGTTYRLVSCQAAEPGANLSTVRMLEAGQVAQHFDIQGLVFEDEGGNSLGCYGELDMVAWPHSLTFNLKLLPEFLYEDGPSDGVVGEGHCVIDTPVDIPHADGSDPEVFTLEFWLKTPKAMPHRAGWLLCKNMHNWQDGNIGFRHWGRTISGVMNIGGGPDNYHELSMGMPRKNEWNHLALTYDGKEMKTYLNGNLTATKAIGKTRNPGDGFMRIGQRGDQVENPATGLYDQIRIWNRPLSHEELKAHANNPGVMPSREGLALEENFDGGKVTRPDWRDATVRLSFKGDKQAWQAEKKVPGAWEILEEKTFTLNCDLRDPATDTISIRLATADNQSFPVSFDKRLNCLKATVKELKRKPDFGKDGERNYDEFLIEVTNTGKARHMVPFLIDFRDGAGITGNVPILCDENGVPTGIPVQLSKNWHEHNIGAYKLPYVILPAETGTTRYMLRYVYGFYGALPSASHAQLSLAGYGGNGRWDQLAIGAWGETICFDVDMSLTDQVVTDIRGLMLRNGLNGSKWGWTDAGHGGDWLVAADHKGDKLLFNDLKTAYLAHGPCLTDARYDGYYGAGREVDLKAQVQTLRTDDYARTFQSLVYRFLKPVSATNSAFYALSQKSIAPKAVYGNRDGVIAELEVPGDARDGDLLADQVTLKGEGPWWVSFPGAMVGHEQEPGTGSGTGYRSLVIRSYEASFGGNKISVPTISLPLAKVDDGRWGIAFRLTPPKGVTEFAPGDQVELDMELITLPRIVDDYYGENQAFIVHLKENPKSWKTVYREAKGNDLAVTVEGGAVIKRYPIIIQSSNIQSSNHRITVDIKGGVGYVPIRFENLASNDYALYEVKQGKEVLLDQSIHGNDYWQTDYDAASGRYAMTFNLPLDGKPASKWILKKKPAPKLAIIMARYGVRGNPAQQVDIKAALQQMADSDINMIVVDNNLAGKDPAPRIRKSLELEFTRNGKRIRKSIPEGHKIDFGTGTGAIKDGGT